MSGLPEGTSPKGISGNGPASSSVPPRPDRIPRLRLLATLAFVLAIIAVALMLPMVPWFGKVMEAPKYTSVPDPAPWVIVLWFTAPVVGILSLVLAAVARRVNRSTGLTGDRLDLVLATKVTAWGAALAWWTLVGVALNQSGAP